ncbi:MAG: D-aminoacyl-tRNA deacylase [Thaumarchaeota archaeon]|nr:D-aminoacyl-tRNA deacylase [Nitrososphaerota archaeon]
MGEVGIELKDVIVCSLNNTASTNVRERLLERFPFQETEEFFGSSPIYSWGNKTIVASPSDIVHVTGLDEKFDDVRYVFASTHRAESGIPSLTAHFTGNFGGNALGGNAHEVARYSPQLLKNYFQEITALRRHIPSAYKITLEATHHGPTELKSPVMFVELGSSEKEWQDTETASLIADAIIRSLDSPEECNKRAIAVGGTHYSDKFNKVELEEEFALGPIIPKYSLDYLDESMLSQIVSKSAQPVKYALLDWKGLGKNKERVLRIIDGAGLEQVKM